MSGIANKVKDTLSGNKSSTEPTTHTTHTTHTTGHTTTTPRTAEPTYNTAGTTHTTAPVGDNYTYGTSGPAPNTDGPHKSDMLNKADPRVDSDRSNINTTQSGAYHTAPTGTATGHTTTTHGTTAPLAGNTTATHGTSGLTGSHQTHGTTTTSSGLREGEVGPHGSRVANTADPRVDSDLDSRRVGVAGQTGTTGHHTTSIHGTNAPLAGNNTAAYGHQTTTTGNVREGEFGPHSSRLANAADPRVDSDLDSRRQNLDSKANPAGNAIHGTTAPLTEPHHPNNNPNRSAGVREGEFGPHSSRLANAADPRVDSDLDSRRHAGNTHTTGTTHTTGPSALGGAATGTTAGYAAGHSAGHTTHATGTSSGLREGEVGPHGSRVANAADPRVDSDLDSRRHAGNTHTTGASTLGGATAGTTAGHTTGHTTHTTGTTAGHTGTSDIGGTTHTTTTTTKGAPSSVNVTTGPAPNTAGPHKSDMMNKLDPRVDSNLDGSKTVGGNKTFAGANVDTTRPVQ